MWEFGNNKRTGSQVLSLQGSQLLSGRSVKSHPHSPQNNENNCGWASVSRCTQQWAMITLVMHAFSLAWIKQTELTFCWTLLMIISSQSGAPHVVQIQRAKALWAIEGWILCGLQTVVKCFLIFSLQCHVLCCLWLHSALEKALTVLPSKVKQEIFVQGCTVPPGSG